MKQSVLIVLFVLALAGIGLSPVYAVERYEISNQLEKPHAAIYTFSDPSLITWGGTTSSTSIMVSGVTGNVTDVNITLYGLAVQTYVAGIQEFDILLVPPSGAANDVILISYVCDNTPGPVTLTLDMNAAGPLPDGATSMCTSGSYQPSDYSSLVGGYILDAPAPAPPYSTDLSILNGLDPNGIWTLYFEEFAGDENGQLTGGWSIEIVDDTVVAPPVTQLNVPHITDILIYSWEQVVAYGSPGGEPARLSNGTIIVLPQDYDGNGFDTYVVTDSTVVDGETWISIFLGNESFAWVQLSQVHLTGPQP